MLSIYGSGYISLSWVAIPEPVDDSYTLYQALINSLTPRGIVILKYQLILNILFPFIIILKIEGNFKKIILKIESNFKERVILKIEGNFKDRR